MNTNDKFLVTFAQLKMKYYKRELKYNNSISFESLYKSKIN